MTTIREWAPAAAMGAAVVAFGLLAAFLATGVNPSGLAPQTVHPIAVIVVLAAIGLALMWWAALGDRVVFSIGVAGMAAKAAGTVVRVELTADAGDAGFYHFAGGAVADWLASGGQPDDSPLNVPRGEGTLNLALAVGRVYRVLGNDINVGFAIFSALSFVGAVLILRAVTIAIPGFASRRFAALVFFLPSMLFWPSTLGKDTWMVAAIGLTVYGTAAVVSGRSLAWGTLIAVGVAMAGWIRPHVAALLTLCVVVSVVWPQLRRSDGSRLRRVLLAALGIAMMTVVLSQVQRFFGTDGIDLERVLDETEAVTSDGGSQFEARRATDPVGLLLGIPSVLLRPFPHEASSGLQLATSFEGVGVVLLAALSWRRLRSLPQLFGRNALVRFTTVYVVGFVVAFSVVSNFGILARQRVQVWPLFLILLCIPQFDRKGRGAAADSAARSVRAQSGP